MTKSTPDVLICFVFKSSPETFLSPLFFKNSFTLPDLPPVRERCSLTLFGLHLDFDLATTLVVYLHGMACYQVSSYIYQNVWQQNPSV